MCPKHCCQRLFFLHFVGIAIGVGCFMPHEFHEPLLGSALDFQHHGPLERAQPVMHQIKGDENCRDPDGHKPFVAHVTRRMKGQALARKFVVELFDQRLERCSFEPQAQVSKSEAQGVARHSVTPNRKAPLGARYQRRRGCHANREADGTKQNCFRPASLLESKLELRRIH